MTIPELSRTYKARIYHRHARKRKRGTKDEHCFEIKTSKNGVGMFATNDIACGDLIIAHEEPIVQIGTNQKTSSLCQVCAKPVGFLRCHHLKAPMELDLPGFDALEKGIEFTKETDRCACPNCEDTSWCSDLCFHSGRKSHWYLQCTGWSSKLQDFMDQQENNSIILQLAVQVVLKTVHHFETLFEEGDKRPIEQFFWWNDYGSHPLWWTIGDPQQSATREEQAIKFSIQLRLFLLDCQKSETHHAINNICTEENIGSILGMLQCNVMEFSYPSPLQQYMEQVEEDFLEEEKPIDNNPLEEGLAWIQENISIRSSENGKGEDVIQKKKLQAVPVVGSGLYPLLTLANHHCDPNASIEFLQESNFGSMVALRDIPTGQEICITYVPNGDVDTGGDENYFRHFQPTRTWKWLNTEDDDDGSSSSSNKEGSVGEKEEGNDAGEEQDNDQAEIEEENSTGASFDEEPEISLQVVEGADPVERAKTLLEYGFQCECSRCVSEKEGVKA